MSLLRRAFSAVGRRLVSLAERPTGRLDATWSARNSTGSKAYEAGVENRSNADWRTGLSTATGAILESLDVMLARSRWLIRNDAYAASAQGGFRRAVVGGGITARAAARDPKSGKQLREFNSAHDALWGDWANTPGLCDVERTKSLYEKQALWMDELFAAGGLLLRAVYVPDPDNVGLAIQELEYEQLDGTLTSFGGNAVYRGIETDAYGAPVAYHVFAAAHPLEESPSVSTRLAADTCWHVFRKTRVRQRLGAPWMAAVMPLLRNLAMYETYTLAKARTEAAYHGFVREPPGSTATLDQIKRKIGGSLPSGDSDDPNNIQVRIENGLFPVLRNGREVAFAPGTTPNSVYEPYVMHNLKRIAAGTGLDMPTVARWYADGNYSTQRMAHLEKEAETEGVQDLLFINGALRGIRERWTEIAVLEGKLSAPGYATSAIWRRAYLTTNWQGPPKRSADKIKDAAAWQMLLGMGLAAPQDYANEQGVDLRDVYSAIAEARDLADEYGIADVIDPFGGGTDHTPKEGKSPDDETKLPSPPPGGNGSGRKALANLIAERAILAGMTEEGQ